MGCYQGTPTSAAKRSLGKRPAAVEDCREGSMKQLNREPSSWSEFGEEFEPILRVDLTEEIIGRIKLLIARGKLKPGSQLPPERDFACMLGVGRPALRQALKALSTMGIIESLVGQGTFISRSTSGFLTTPMDFMRLLSAVTLPELFEVRKAVEVELAGLAAERASEKELAVIEATLKNQGADLDIPEVFLVEDLHFHNAIAKAAHNVLFTAILESLGYLSIESRRKLLLAEKDTSNSFNDHQEIFRRIVGRDKVGAREAMFSHLARVFHYWEEAQQRKDAPVE
jgi:GntR family transcriptional regulator, transcriptional repressor for pyruvate dehydrogenase complex